MPQLQLSNCGSAFSQANHFRGTSNQRSIQSTKRQPEATQKFFREADFGSTIASVGLPYTVFSNYLASKRLGKTYSHHGVMSMKKERVRYIPVNQKYEMKQLLGYTVRELYGSSEPIYLEGFKWDCDWYWGGGYLGNKNLHTHFDGCFLESPDPRGHSLGNFVTHATKDKYKDRMTNFKVVDNYSSVWEPLNFFLDKSPQHLVDKWWRIKDLYRQFYSYKEAAATFQYGGHCTGEGRIDDEINYENAITINRHIELVIIPQIIKTVKGE